MAYLLFFIFGLLVLWQMLVGCVIEALDARRGGRR